MDKTDKLVRLSDVRRAILSADPRLSYIVDRLKTVEAAEVVRCKDCKHRYDGMCALDERYEYPWHCTKDDAFCSYGERSADEQT